MKTTAKGAAARIFHAPAKLNATKTNPERIFNSACPAVILANSRTDKLITLDSV